METVYAADRNPAALVKAKTTLTMETLQSAYSGKLYDSTSFQPSNAVWAALKRHFEARLISAHNPKPEISLARIKQTEYQAFNAYSSGPAGGNQTSRTAAGKRGTRDASWIMYYVAEDGNAHMSSTAADYAWKRSAQSWGQVQSFLKCQWDEREFQLAIVKPYDVEHRIKEIARGNMEFCPMSLIPTGAAAHALQILDVNAITAIAGRVKLSTSVNAGEVIFETSLDTQRAEMDFS
ncbi:hypothetical protein QFC21_002597 [Naganishia friedmannii]|uniref:Uncharacterized protein n=1 Tax=Naganishia friedmannii TaxID=89922 RepID=A0ACC2VVP2_9TREE|nr:hypothetical protein QFC21_002597 [Naganishia friedmannii]